MTDLHVQVTASVTPTHDRPPADKVISGDPQFTNWLLEDRDGLYCGIWQATLGKWRLSYDEWEYFRLTAGHSILTPEGGEPIHLRAGDSHIVRPGMNGTWEVVETTVKDYVIRI